MDVNESPSTAVSIGQTSLEGNRAGRYGGVVSIRGSHRAIVFLCNSVISANEARVQWLLVNGLFRLSQLSCRLEAWCMWATVLEWPSP